MNSIIERSCSKELDEVFFSKFKGDGIRTEGWVRKSVSNLREQSTKPEILTAEYLERKGVVFYPQMPFRVPKGNSFKIYIADFYIPELRTIIEVDGKTTHDKDKDAERDEDFSNLGIKTIRISASAAMLGKFGGIDFIPKDKKSRGKAIFYTAVLQDSRLSACDKMVYSQFVYSAYLRDKNLWTSQSGAQNETETWVELPKSPADSLYKKLNMSRRQFYQSKSNLRDCGYITTISGEPNIQIISGVEHNFFELKTDTGLSNSPLIVYSYIYHLSKKYGWVDKYHKSIGSALNMQPATIIKNIQRLCEQGFLEKKRRGRQFLLKPKVG